jgi:hypothetical protein
MPQASLAPIHLQDLLGPPPARRRAAKQTKNCAIDSPAAGQVKRRIWKIDATAQFFEQVFIFDQSYKQKIKIEVS